MARGPLKEIRAVLAIEGLPRRLKHTLLTLACHAPRIYPSQARLAQEMGVSRSTVNENLAALETLGLIAREPGHSKRSTRYKLTLQLSDQPTHTVRLTGHQVQEVEAKANGTGNGSESVPF